MHGQRVFAAASFLISPKPFLMDPETALPASQHFVPKSQHHYTFSSRHPPVLTVKPGECVRIETWDCFSGKIKGPEDAAVLDTLEMSELNPVTGPIFVDGAEPGQRHIRHMYGCKERGQI